MAIYLDAVWLLNFFIDWMILQLVHWLSRAETSRYRLIFGSVVASCLVPITVLFPGHFITSFPGKIMYSVLILFSAFGFHNVKRFLRQFFTFYFVSFTIGGGLFGVYFLIGEQFQAVDGFFVTYETGFGDMVSWIFVITCFPIVWWFTRRRIDQLGFDQMRYTEMCPVQIAMDGKLTETVGFFDSGNSLVDPFSKRPVIICDEVALQQWLPDEDREMLRQCQDDWTFEHLSDYWQSKIRIIPYQGVSGKRNFILVLKPDQITIEYKGVKYAIEKVYIGIQFGELSADGSYHCLLHPKMMQSQNLQLT
ncbi:sigma-E processing peptidase SpoIIGA [Salirhabdus salicampi]|uniref:sigma-E processing peptidase SpoIIGA n=1 Tax=Salirhabdus salicampi TaxID=476102 RepID=UPI0020C3A3F8|nr:sigma-E processing peptidase SpoIIGA [Salirhabdus salicampi]